MKNKWPVFITHLLAFTIGWTLMHGGKSDEPSSEYSASIKSRASGSLRHPDKNSDNPWLQATPADYRAAWDEMLRKPRSFSTPGGALTADHSLAEMNFLRMWARVDTAAALKGLGDLRLNPVTIVILEDFITECGPGSPEPFFKQVPAMQNLPVLRTVPLLAKLAAQVAAENPQRARELVGSMPAGEMRALVLSKMLGALDEPGFRTMAGLIGEDKSGSSSHTEITLVRTALEKQLARRKMANFR